jgi:methyl-accepting chemotaxis protein
MRRKAVRLFRNPIQSLARIREAISRSSGVSREMGKRAGEISGIVDTIDLIAERTTCFR